MRRLFVVTMVALTALFVTALVPAAFGAADLRNPDGSIPQLERSWVNKSNIPAPAVPIVFSRDTSVCVGHPLGCASQTPGAYSIHIAAIASTFDYRWTIRHEVGHIFDAAYLTDADRAEFLHIIGEDGAPWRQGISPSDQEAPIEMFADHYALCAINNRRPPINSKAQPGYQTPRRHRLVCKLIADVSRRNR